jgi:hypothetical protein
MKIGKKDTKLRLFGLWLTFTHQNLFLAISFLDYLIVYKILFIEKEFEHYMPLLFIH